MGAWAILSDLLGLVDEPTHARRVMAELAETAILLEHRPLVEAAVCSEVAGVRLGDPARTTLCRFDTPCGVAAEGAVFFEPITGAVTTATDFANFYLDICPEMLTEEARQRLGEDQERERLLRPPGAPTEPAP